MGETYCPICWGALEVREVAPCWDCGSDPKELEHLREGRHTYAEMRVIGAGIVLCNFCQVDFDSYDPTFFGKERGTRCGRDMVFVRDVPRPEASLDKYCPVCHLRLAFLRFLAEVGGGSES